MPNLESYVGLVDTLKGETRFVLFKKLKSSLVTRGKNRLKTQKTREQHHG